MKNKPKKSKAKGLAKIKAAKKPKAKAKKAAKKPKAKAKKADKKPKVRAKKTAKPRKGKPQKELIIGGGPAPEKKKKSLSRGGIKKHELRFIRQGLLEQRDQIMAAMRRAQELDTSPEVGDEADQAGLSIERELQFELSDNERTTLDQIEGALRKMDKGTFGQCEQCRLPIETLRVKALPFARYCIQCQNTSERATATLL